MGGQQVGRERERGQEVEVQQGPDAAPEVERAEEGQQGSEVTAAVHSKATPNSGLCSQVSDLVRDPKPNMFLSRSSSSSSWPDLPDLSMATTTKKRK